MNRPGQLDRLLEAGVAEVAGISAAELAAYAPALPDEPHEMLAVHPSLATGGLAPLLRHHDKPGFVVEDMTDLEQFVPIAASGLPDRPLYLMRDPTAGMHAELDSRRSAARHPERGRTPLTINEGISWLLQEPKMLEPNHCFMTIGSRKPKATRSTPEPPPSGSAAEPATTAAPSVAPPRSAGAGPGTVTPRLGFASALQRTG